MRDLAFDMFEDPKLVKDQGGAGCYETVLLNRFKTFDDLAYADFRDEILLEDPWTQIFDSKKKIKRVSDGDRKLKKIREMLDSIMRCLGRSRNEFQIALHVRSIRYPTFPLL
jgi:hypothetical protein